MTTLESLIGDTLIFGIPGPRPTLADLRLFRETHARGLILYRINYRSPEQIRSLLRDMEESLGRRLTVTLDHEGGRVVMFPEGLTIFPDNLAFGVANRPSWTAAQGRAEGAELRRLGIDVSFSPTVDVLTRDYSPNIGIRSYGFDPHRVAALATARIRALQRRGVSACAKHFPGLGPATIDPHLDLPVIDVGWRELRKTHLLPFQVAIRAGVQMVMSSHPLYPRLDPAPKTPATFSRRLISDLLRREMNFTGVIASDDLEMGALHRLCPVDRAAVLAARAGHDLILCCHRADLQRRVFHGLREAYLSGVLKTRDLELSVERIRTLPSLHRPRFAPGAARPEPDGSRLAREVARTAVTVRGGPESPALPLRARRPLIVFPRFAPRASRIMVEPDLIRPLPFLRRSGAAGGGRPRVSLVEMDPTSADVARVAREAARADTAVFFCYDAHLHPGNRRLLRRLESLEIPFVLVLLRDPYDAEFAGPETLVVTAQGYRQCQIAACLKGIFG